MKADNEKIKTTFHVNHRQLLKFQMGRIKKRRTGRRSDKVAR